MISALFAGVISFAQVGINTAAPQSTLDVNGDITLRNELRVGGTKTTNGNPGTNNQILVSQPVRLEKVLLPLVPCGVQ